MAVVLAFADEKIRQTCESGRSARRRLGQDAAECLQARLADLLAADSPSDLLVLQLAHPDLAFDNRLVIPLCNGYVLVASVNHRPEPRSPSGELDWKQVSRIKILSIERANEN